MSEATFDALTRIAGKGVTRRDALRGLATVLGGALFTLVGSRKGFAAPQTCVTCICGVGNPCNPKSTTCTEIRSFPAETACSQACAATNQHLCGLGETFHCPHGCPS